MKKKNITTVVSLILDRSGSMSSIQNKTIDAVNEYINGLRGQKGQVLFSLTTFDSLSLEHPYTLTPIKQVEGLTEQTYQPRGNTPLYDSAVETIEALDEEIGKMEVQPAVLVAIMTDGMENASKVHDESCLKDLIGKLEKKGNWTFVYMGANQNSWNVAQKFGININNTMNWESTGQGVTRGMSAMAASTLDWASQMATNNIKGLSISSTNFFNGTGTKR